MQLTAHHFWIPTVQYLSFFSLALKGGVAATPASQLVVVVARSSHDSGMIQMGVSLHLSLQIFLQTLMHFWLCPTKMQSVLPIAWKSALSH